MSHSEVAWLVQHLGVFGDFGAAHPDEAPGGYGYPADLPPTAVLWQASTASFHFLLRAACSAATRDSPPAV